MSEPPRRPPAELRRDVEAALEARRELGPDYEDQIAAGLAEHVDELVAMRLADARLANQDRALDREDERSSRTQRFVLGIISLGAGIPVTAITAGTDLGITGTVVGWTGIVAVNLAAAWGNRRRRS